MSGATSNFGNADVTT